RVQFQDTFAIRDDQGKLIEISSLSDLVSSDEGVKKWQNMYQQIGIRSTRHQTFKLSDEYLELLKEVQRDKYRNLPVWSRRNGIIVYIHQMDNFFDQIIVDKLNEKKNSREKLEIDEFTSLRKSTIDYPKERDIQNLQNELEETIIRINEEDYTDRIKEDKIAFEQKNTQQRIQKLDKIYAPKETALSIYKYINDQLTGNLSIADYRSSRIRDYDDFKLHMVVKLMTNGIATNDDNGTIKIKDKVLLFSDAQTQVKVYNWLMDDMNQSSFEEKGISLEQYQTSYRHDPLWYYNSQKKNPDDKWIITTDIRTLNDTQGNYLIIVEPDKYEEGVDLQTSNTLINFDIKFDPLKMEQRIGRIDRVKLGSEQSNLQIISFTPLNDLSGFMVDFLANELKMFNRWRGDTTGIVTMPLGDKPNSATFNDAMLALNDAYKAIYNSDYVHYMDSLNKIESLNDLFLDKGIAKIGQIKKKEELTLHDFQYLKDNKSIVNEIIFNTYTNTRDGDRGKILFGPLRQLANRKSFEDNEITADSLNSHVNDLEHLQQSIHQYYQTNIRRIKDKIEKIRSLYKDKGDEMQKIEASNTSREYNDYNQMTDELDSLVNEYSNFKNGALANKPLGVLYIEKNEADLSLDPILNRYRNVVNKYLNPLIEIFDKLSSQVTEKSDKMSKFISYITMEEFRIMADNHE
ncbi:MAG: helicase-related protein, partial [Acholeplasmataceae bacterium]|nr:helicase-related protein [Acholeplasmataceae bacterium]